MESGNMVNGYNTTEREYTFRIMRPLGAPPVLEVTSGKTVEETYVPFRGRSVLVAVMENGVNGSAQRYGMVIGYPTTDIYHEKDEDTNNVKVEPIPEKERIELSDIVRRETGLRVVNFMR